MDVAASGYGHWAVRGTPTQIADQMEERFLGGCGDGFNLMPATLPDGLDGFHPPCAAGIAAPRPVPHRIYRQAHLRDHLGLARPARRITRAA